MPPEIGRRRFLELVGFAALSVQIGGCAEETAPEDSLTVASSRNSKLGRWAAHSHLLYVPLRWLETPPRDGVSLSTAWKFLHAHEVALSRDELITVARGGLVRVADTAEAHTYSIQLGAPLPGV